MSKNTCFLLHIISLLSIKQFLRMKASFIYIFKKNQENLRPFEKL